MRLSDLAPKAEVLIKDTKKPVRLVFSTDNVTFENDGRVMAVFFGIKNDTDRSGIKVSMPSEQPDKINPRSVQALLNYIA